jgi:signal peptidase II
MIWVIIVAVIVALDQITKYSVIKSIGFGELIPVIDRFFYLTYYENKGAAWGILQNGRYFFIVLTIIVSVIIAYYIYKSDSKLQSISLSLVLGGAIGNLIDRVYKGGVTDFLDFHFGSYNFPTFNVADSFVVVGTSLLAYYLLFVYKEKEDINEGN